jgi:DNA modification methylase
MLANLEAGLQHIRIGQWVKLNATPQFTGDRPATGAEAVVISHPKGRKRWNGGGTHAVWTHAIAIDRASTGEERCHTTQKPVPLMLELVSLFTDPGELVLDAFCGSGTTGVACLRLGRRFIGIEKDSKYAAVARERLRAEANGLSLRDARAGQLPMFGAP